MMREKIKNLLRVVILAVFAFHAIGAVVVLGFYAWHSPTCRELASRYWWAPFSAAYTIGSMWWTWRAERLLRKLRSEQKVMSWAYEDLRQDVDAVEAFLENGNTLRQIPLRGMR